MHKRLNPTTSVAEQRSETERLRRRIAIGGQRNTNYVGDPLKLGASLGHRQIRRKGTPFAIFGIRSLAHPVCRLAGVPRRVDVMVQVGHVDD